MHSALRQRMSRVFQRLDEIISHVATAAVVSFVLIVFIVSLALRGFPPRWQMGFSTVANAIVIMLLFALKHTQDRQQTALQLSSTSSFDLPRRRTIIWSRSNVPRRRNSSSACAIRLRCTTRCEATTASTKSERAASH